MSNTLVKKTSRVKLCLYTYRLNLNNVFSSSCGEHASLGILNIHEAKMSGKKIQTTTYDIER